MGKRTIASLLFGVNITLTAELLPALSPALLLLSTTLHGGWIPGFILWTFGKYLTSLSHKVNPGHCKQAMQPLLAHEPRQDGGAGRDGRRVGGVREDESSEQMRSKPVGL